MDIPFSIKVFSWIYESGKYLLPLLLLMWLTWLISVTILRKRKPFLYTSVLFFVFCLLNIFFTWSGWHYRMELRNRYAVVQKGEPGWQPDRKVFNINRMPADIQYEYQKNNSRPRQRAVWGQVVLTIILIPVTLAGQWILYLIFFRHKKDMDKDRCASLPDWKYRFARAGFIAGAVLGIGHFMLLGSATNWLLCSCIPLIFPLYFGSWKNWRTPALVLMLLFSWGGVISCIKDFRCSERVNAIHSMYHNRAGFDFQKIFPPLPDNVAIRADGSGGMSFKNLHANEEAYTIFLSLLPSKGFTPLEKNSVVWKYHGGNDIQKMNISGTAFHKYLGNGFGAVAEYNGDCCRLYIIRGLGE